MTLLDIRKEIIDFLMNRTDSHLTFDQGVNQDNTFLNDKTRFIITNKPPTNPSTPNYQLDNVDQIKWLLSEVHGHPEQKDIIYKIVDDYILSHSINVTDKMYISIF